MLDVDKLGWDVHVLGEIDHRQVKAPYVRLSSYTVGEKGDIVYFYDLRLTQPNTQFLTTTELHSMEHFLLAGFRKYLPKNFICVAPMGCRTGLYLVLLNEGRAQQLLDVYECILKDILAASSVPYQDVKDCGHWVDHDVARAQAVARRLLDCKEKWLQVL